MRPIRRVSMVVLLAGTTAYGCQSEDSPGSAPLVSADGSGTSGGGHGGAGGAADADAGDRPDAPLMKDSFPPDADAGTLEDAGFDVSDASEDVPLSPECNAHQLMCQGSCTDVRSDAENCGDCAVQCDTIASCVAGRCVKECTTTTFNWLTDVALPGWPTSIAVADVDGNGRPDVVVGTTVGTVFAAGTGSGSFTDLQTVDSTATQGVALLPLDANTLPDIVQERADSMVMLALQHDGTFANVGQVDVGEHTGTVAVADIDGNGALDVVLAQLPDADNVLRVSGFTVTAGAVPGLNPAQNGAVAALAGAGGLRLAFGFLDATPFRDVLVLRQGELFRLANEGRSFGPAIKMATSSFCHGVTVGDFDGNGTDDVAATSGAHLDTFLSTTTGLPASPTTVPLLANSIAGAVVAGDFDGNGHLDLAVASNRGSSSVISMLPGDGHGSFPSPVGGYGTNTVVDVVAEDLDVDGRLDLVVITSEPPAIRVLHNECR